MTTISPFSPTFSPKSATTSAVRFSAVEITDDIPAGKLTFLITQNKKDSLSFQRKRHPDPSQLEGWPGQHPSSTEGIEIDGIPAVRQLTDILVKELISIGHSRLQPLPTYATFKEWFDNNGGWEEMFKGRRAEDALRSVFSLAELALPNDVAISGHPPLSEFPDSLIQPEIEIVPVKTALSGHDKLGVSFTYRYGKR